MPIYIYKSTTDGCEYCKDGFEQIQTMSAKPLAKCPKCGGKVKKIPARCHSSTNIPVSYTHLTLPTSDLV